MPTRLSSALLQTPSNYHNDIPGRGSDKLLRSNINVPFGMWNRTGFRTRKPKVTATPGVEQSLDFITEGLMARWWLHTTRSQQQVRHHLPTLRGCYRSPPCCYLSTHGNTTQRTFRTPIPNVQQPFNVARQLTTRQPLANGHDPLNRLRVVNIEYSIITLAVGQSTYSYDRRYPGK